MRLSAHTYRRLAVIACTKHFPWSKAKPDGELSYHFLIPFCEGAIAKTEALTYIINPEYKPNEDELKVLNFLLDEYQKYCESPEYRPLGFETDKSLKLFGSEMVVINAIDDIMQCVYQAQWDLQQKSEVVFLLVQKLCSSERELSQGLRAVLPDFAAILRKILSEEFTKKRYDLYLNKYIDLYHYLSLSPEKVTPDKGEYSRREHISATKQKNFSEKREHWKHHAKEIHELCQQGKTVKKACEIYFEENQEILKNEGISSVRTLQNKLTGQKHPDRRRKERNEIDAALPIQNADLSRIEKLINSQHINV